MRRRKDTFLLMSAAESAEETAEEKWVSRELLLLLRVIKSLERKEGNFALLCLRTPLLSSVRRPS